MNLKIRMTFLLQISHFTFLIIDRLFGGSPISGGPPFVHKKIDLVFKESNSFVDWSLQEGESRLIQLDGTEILTPAVKNYQNQDSKLSFILKAIVFISFLKVMKTFKKIMKDLSTDSYW